MISEGHMPGSHDPKMSRFKVETIAGLNGGEVSCSPERGGIITSLKLHGTEVLYMNDDTFADSTKNVKGGIPVLFPNAGPLEDEGNPYPGLKQHGFARTSSRWVAESTTGARLSERLASDEETRRVFPYDVETRMSVEFHEDGSAVLVQEATNQEADRDMPLAMGLHPYFRVLNERKKDIKFAFPGGEYINSHFERWSNGEMVSIPNPGVELRIEIPGLGTLILDVSEEYQKIWVWSLSGQDFICIEPVMRDVGGLITDPAMVKPGETLSGRVSVQLEPEKRTDL